MKPTVLFALGVLACLSPPVASQVSAPEQRHYQEPIPVRPLTHPAGHSGVLPRSIHRSRYDWEKLIDSTWGMGLPLNQKLQVFDSYAARLATEFDGFLSLGLNWDSLRTSYRSQIDSTTSRGRFSGIMTRFAMSLRDVHTYAMDTMVTSTPLSPGVPLAILYGFATVEHFGAVLTALPDSTALVLRTVPGHPLGLQPGDIVLGYDGVLWKNLLPQLLNAGFPLYSYGEGGAASAAIHHKVRCVGLNWHLFDTIDILKQATNDTVHLSVAPLAGLPSAPMLSNEQLDIPGIPFPDYFAGKQVTYGKLPGTNIGYIYLFVESPTLTVDQAFFGAVHALWETDGLMIDVRWNHGGWALFDQAFALMFSQRLRTIESAYRTGPGTFDLVASGDWGLCEIPGAAGSIYDRPIAVLVGPACASMGDVTVQRLRYHPMVRFFGKSSWASLGDNKFLDGHVSWLLRYSISDAFHCSQPDIYLNRREFPIDEPVWFNPGDVANGIDPVVAKAVDWIATLTYAHDAALNPGYGRPGLDSVGITAALANPLQHAVVLSAIVTDTSGVVRDSALLYNDGLHGDKSAGDSVWGGHIRVPSDENVFSVRMRTDDVTQRTFRKLPDVVGFATAGPLRVDSIQVTMSDDGSYMIKPFLKNHGASFTVPGVSVTLSCADSWVEDMTPKTLALPSSIPPGGIVSASGVCYVYTAATFPGYFNLKFEIASNGFMCWTDARRATVTGVREVAALPVAYALHQNYPNPFNPSTTIKFELPKASQVSLTVHDILGREVSVLVNERRDAGVHEVTFDASALSSGVYFYRLKAGNFVQTRQLLLLK